MDPEKTPHDVEQGSSVQSNASSNIPNEESKPPAWTYPEGGFRAWATVLGAFLVQFCGFGYTTSFGVYQDFYTRDYLSQSSSSAISWIGSINTFIVISGASLQGVCTIGDIFSHHLIIGGSLLQIFSIFMLSLCKPQQLYQIFLAQGLGMGLGAGTVYVPTVAVVSHYFSRRRALAMSIVASGSSLGAVVHPIMLNNTLRRLGFATAVRASGGLIGGLLVIACLLLRPRYPPKVTPPPFWRSLPRFFLHDRPYLLAVLAMFTYTVGFYFPLFYLQLDAVTHGISQNLSFYSLVIMNASSFVGRLTPGFFAHRLGVLNIITVGGGIGAVLILSMIALKSVASVIVIGILYGFTAGTFITLMGPLMAVLTDNMSDLRMGVAFAIVGFGGLIGPPISGALLTSQFRWWRPALFSGIMAVVGFGFFCATVVALRRKNRLKREAKEREEKEQTQNKIATPADAGATGDAEAAAVTAEKAPSERGESVAEP